MARSLVDGGLQPDRRSCSIGLLPREDETHATQRRLVMSSTVHSGIDVHPFQVEIPSEALDDLRRRIAATRWPSKELVARPVAGRAAGDDAGARALLGDRVRLRARRGAAERAAAVRDRDRRRGHPLHPRQVAARERAAADHDPRLARLGDRAARLRRPADRPDRARRQRRGCLPSRAALPARVRASPASRPRSAGTWAGPHGPGPS